MHWPFFITILRYTYLLTQLVESLEHNLKGRQAYLLCVIQRLNQTGIGINSATKQIIKLQIKNITNLTIHTVNQAVVEQN